MTSKTARVPLTQGNLTNHHFYLRTCGALIPEGGLGGANKSDPGRPFRVRFEPGPTVDTDVAGDKMILRDRKAVRAFFETAAAEAGDVVVIEASSEREWRVWLDKV